MRLDLLAGMARLFGIILIILAIETSKSYERYGLPASLVFSLLMIISAILLGLYNKEDS